MDVRGTRELFYAISDHRTERNVKIRAIFV